MQSWLFFIFWVRVGFLNFIRDRMSTIMVKLRFHATRISFRNHKIKNRTLVTLYVDMSHTCISFSYEYFPSLYMSVCLSVCHSSFPPLSLWVSPSLLILPISFSLYTTPFQRSLPFLSCSLFSISLSISFPSRFFSLNLS